MKRIAVILGLMLLPTLAMAEALQQYQPGFRTINGTQLNKMVDVVNGLTGNGGTASSGYFSLNTTGTTGPTPQTSTVLQAVGANTASARIELDAYAGVPLVSLVRRNGTKASPTAILDTNQLGSFNFHGAASTTAIYGPAARVSAYATENWSGTAGGTKLVLSVTPNTTQTIADALVLDQDKSATFNGKLITVSTIPTLSSCGTGTIVTGSTNTAGQVTATGATGCVVTFVPAYTSAPFCVVTDLTGTRASMSTTVIAASITIAGMTSGDTFSYMCMAKTGG